MDSFVILESAQCRSLIMKKAVDISGSRPRWAVHPPLAGAGAMKGPNSKVGCASTTIGSRIFIFAAVLCLLLFCAGRGLAQSRYGDWIH